MKKVMIGIGAFVSGVITGATAMLVYKNIQIGKKSKLHEENYNNLNDLFGQQDSPNKTNIFNDTFSSSFSKSDLVDVFGVNFDSGDENYEEDEEDWAPIEVKNSEDDKYNRASDESEDIFSFSADEDEDILWSSVDYDEDEDEESKDYDELVTEDEFEDEEDNEHVEF